MCHVHERPSVSGHRMENVLVEALQQKTVTIVPIIAHAAMKDVVKGSMKC